MACHLERQYTLHRLSSPLQLTKCIVVVLQLAMQKRLTSTRSGKQHKETGCCHLTGRWIQIVHTCGPQKNRMAAAAAAAKRFKFNANTQSGNLYYCSIITNCPAITQTKKLPWPLEPLFVIQPASQLASQVAEPS